MNRKEAREYTMQALFQMEVQQDFAAPDMERYLSREELGKQKEYVEELLTAICRNIDRVNDTIDRCSEGWPVSRMTKMDLAIIRLAVGEILFLEDIPAAVSINEAVELARKYGTDQSPKFVNAVLGKIA